MKVFQRRDRRPQVTFTINNPVTKAADPERGSLSGEHVLCPDPLVLPANVLNGFLGWLGEEIDRLPEVVEFGDGSISLLEDVRFDGATFKRLLLQLRDLFSAVHDSSSVGASAAGTADASQPTLEDAPGVSPSSSGGTSGAPLIRWRNVGNTDAAHGLVDSRLRFILEPWRGNFRLLDATSYGTVLGSFIDLQAVADSLVREGLSLDPPGFLA